MAIFRLLVERGPAGPSTPWGSIPVTKSDQPPLRQRHAPPISDDEVIEGIRLLGRTEGIFTETAGGGTVSVTKRLAEQGRFKPDDVVVIAITGNGLKPQEALVGQLGHPVHIEANLSSLDAALTPERLLAVA